MNNDYNSFDNNEEEYKEVEEQEEDTLYTDGDDKRPKLVIIIVGIVILLILILLFTFACSKINKKSNNNNLSSLRIENGVLSPNFDKNVLDYEVTATEDIVKITCSTENTKASTEGCKRLYITDNCISHEIKVRAQDKTQKIYKLNICKGNENVPIIKNVDINPSSYTSGNVTVTITAESTTPLHESAYSIDNGLTWQKSNKFTITENKVLEIKVRTEDNTESQVLLKEINNIDKSDLKVTIKGSVDSGKATTSNVELTAFVTAQTQDGIKYEWYKNNKKISDATGEYYKATGSGEYKVKVILPSGKSATSAVYKVNKKSSSGPSSNPSSKYTLSITGVSGNPTSWTKSDVTLTVKATASNGLAGNAYSFDGGKTYQSSASKKFTSNTTVNIVVKDKKNNTTSYRVHITKIDKTVPNVTISGSYITGNTLTANVNPKTTSSGYKYEWYKDGKIISGATLYSYIPTSVGNYKVKVTTGAGNSKTSQQVSVSAKIQPTVTITASVPSGTWSKKPVTLTATVRNGTATRYEWYRDNSKYSSCTSSTCTVSTYGTYKVRAVTTTTTTDFSGAYVAKIDNAAPGVSIGLTLNSDPKKPYTVNTWTKEIVNINVVAVDATSAIKAIYIQTATNGSWNMISKASGSQVAVYNITNTGTYNVTVKVVDVAGNEAVKTVGNIKVDKTGPKDPTIKLSSTVETSSNVTFTITPGTDANAGVKQTEYSYDNKTWSKYSSTANLLTTTGVKTVYARTIDNVGNISKVVSATGKCDKDAVTVDRKTNGDNSTGCYIQLSFKITNSGLTGISKDTYQYAYWNATQTTDSSNNESGKWKEKCGEVPPSGAIIKTTNPYTNFLYQKYKNQYYCFAVRPYRSTEISGINRWTIQRKHASTVSTKCKSTAYNGK